MTLSEDARRLWLAEHIPYRLRAINALSWWIDRVSSAGSLDAGIQGIVVEIDCASMTPLDYTNRIVDGGLLSARWLMEFLGVTVTNSKQRKLKAAPRNPKAGHDVGVEDFPPATKLSPNAIAPVGLVEALVYILAASNAGTMHPADGTSGLDLGLTRTATDGIVGLVRARLYEKLEIPLPAGTEFNAPRGFDPTRPKTFRTLRVGHAGEGTGPADR